MGLNGSTVELNKHFLSGICLYIPFSSKRPADDVQPVPEENEDRPVKTLAIRISTNQSRRQISRSLDL